MKVLLDVITLSKRPFILLVGYQFKPTMAKAIRRIKHEIGDVFDFKFYNTHEIDNEVIDIESFANELKSADIVLIDIRGGDLVTKVVFESLKDQKNTVVCLIGGSDQLFKLTRLGSFSFASF